MIYFSLYIWTYGPPWPLIVLKIIIIITKHGSALYIGMAKALSIIDVLGYDRQNSNPRRAGYGSCRVCVCVCVCVSVCPLSHISPLGLLFVVKTLPRTQRAKKVKKCVAFSLKMFSYTDRALPPLMAIRRVGY